jgi:hypothetical protein
MNEKEKLLQRIAHLENSRQEIMDNGRNEINGLQNRMTIERDAWEKEKRQILKEAEEKSQLISGPRPSDPASQVHSLFREKLEPNQLFREMLENISDQSIDIDKFEGFGDVTVDEWIADLKSIRDLKGWSENQTFRRAMTRLEDPAKSAVRNNTHSIRDLAELEKFLRDAYDVREPFAYYADKLASIKQGRDTGRKFVDRFQTIKTKLDASCPGQFSDNLYVEFFKRALRKEYRVEVQREKAKTLLKAMRVVRHADDFLLDTYQDSINLVSSDSKMEKILRQMEKMQNQLSGQASQWSRNNSRFLEKNQMFCQVCNRTNHFTEECRHLNSQFSSRGGCEKVKVLTPIGKVAKIKVFSLGVQLEEIKIFMTNVKETSQIFPDKGEGILRIVRGPILGIGQETGIVEILVKIRINFKINGTRTHAESGTRRTQIGKESKIFPKTSWKRVWNRMLRMIVSQLVRERVPPTQTAIPVILLRHAR